MLTTLHLSNWVPWESRSTLPNGPGVYVIGNAADVIYVGRTWGNKGLRNRVRGFHRSATTGLPGHAGGLTFHQIFGADVERLRVRVHSPVAINPDEQILRPYIEYAERRLIWEYVEEHGQLPACNSV